VKPNLDDLQSFIDSAKELQRAQKSFEKKSAKARDVDMSMSARAIGKATADMHWDAMHVERCWDALHAHAVNLGLCDAHVADFYREKTMKWSGFHGAAYTPKKPRCIEAKQKEASNAG